MKLYKAKVRCSGEVKDEVRKKDMTAAEVRLLRAIHGDDAVLEVTETGTVERTESEERERLAKIYGEANVLRLFGAPVVAVTDEIANEEVAPKAVEDDLPVVKRETTAESLVA